MSGKLFPGFFYFGFLHLKLSCFPLTLTMHCKKTEIGVSLLGSSQIYLFSKNRENSSIYSTMFSGSRK